MALGISLYFILPIAYLFAYASIGNLSESCQLPIDNNALSFGVPSSNSVFAFVNFIKSIDLTSFLSSLGEATSRVIVNFCFLPLFALAVALTTTNIGSTVFGAKLAEIGRGLVKLI